MLESWTPQSLSIVKRQTNIADARLGTLATERLEASKFHLDESPLSLTLSFFTHRFSFCQGPRLSQQCNSSVVAVILAPQVNGLTAYPILIASLHNKGKGCRAVGHQDGSQSTQHCSKQGISVTSASPSTVANRRPSSHEHHCPLQ